MNELRLPDVEGPGMNGTTGHSHDCSIDWPFLAAWLNSKWMWKTAQKLPNSYVGEPALPSPFGILLLTSNFAIHSPVREDKENQLSTTIIFLVKSTHLCSRAHMTKFVFHNVSWAWLNCSNFKIGFFFPFLPSNQYYTSRMYFRWQEKTCSCPSWK